MHPSAPESRVAQRILFAEDHEASRVLVADLLRKAGYTVDVAADGVAALDLYLSAPSEYDVLLTDHDMPRMDGAGLAGRIREERFQGSIIVMSGALGPNEAAAYTPFEVDSFLLKPISAGTLIETIRGLTLNPLHGATLL